MFINHLDIRFKEGIHEFNIKNSITLKVGKFYAENPFPDYKIDDTKHTIQKIGDNNLLMKELKRFVGFNKSLLEVGSGTCQLSNYLAIGTNNKICAFDSSLQSLKLGREFAKRIISKILILLEVIFWIKFLKMEFSILFGVMEFCIIQTIHMKHLDV